MQFDVLSRLQKSRKETVGMKKWTAILIVFALMISTLAGCSQVGRALENGSTESTSQEETSKPADPVALDQACIDLIYEQAAGDGASLVERIESRNGLHTLEHAEEIGLGSRMYELVSIDE